MSELLYVHSISPIPNVLQDNFHIFFRFLELRKTCNIKQKILVVIADDWGALWAHQSSAMTLLGSRCQNLHYDTPKRAYYIFLQHIISKLFTPQTTATIRKWLCLNWNPVLQRQKTYYMSMIFLSNVTTLNSIVSNAV